MADRIFTMDGSWHYFGARREKCCWAGGPCPCGGWIHSQSVYGPSIAWCCDRCGDDEHPEHAQGRTPPEPPTEIHPDPCWKCGAVEQFHHCPVSALEKR